MHAKPEITLFIFACQNLNNKTYENTLGFTAPPCTFARKQRTPLAQNYTEERLFTCGKAAIIRCFLRIVKMLSGT